LKILAILLILTLSIGVIPLTPSYAHSSGCHRWHSCPSDSGSYTCGDLGYDTYCLKNTVAKSKPKVQTKTQSTNTSKCSGTALCITDKVTRIIDGDTISIKNYMIRLSLTNTPEKNQAGFSDATSFTSNLCPVGSTITVDQDDKQPYDKYKRLVGKVFCGDKVLNSELLFSNHASILKKYCSTSEFSGEDWAKKYGC
jgi:endonuclease YncB( thermonuclease family)